MVFRCVRGVPHIHHSTSSTVGQSTANFTSTSDLFLAYPQIDYWRLEVIYSFANAQTLSALNLQLNRPPRNGSCSISPINGSTSTLFTVTCASWFDEDGILDYSLHSNSSRYFLLHTRLTPLTLAYTNNRSTLTIVAFSNVPTFQLRFSIDHAHTIELPISLRIRDSLDCVTDVDLSSITLTVDQTELEQFIANPTDPRFTQIFASGNQNAIGQVISVFAQQLNQRTQQELQQAYHSRRSYTSTCILIHRLVLSGGFALDQISISPLTGIRPSIMNRVIIDHITLSSTSTFALL
jgi:hypothetical protein